MIATPSLMVLNFSPAVYINGIVALGSVGENWKIVSDNPVRIFMKQGLCFFVFLIFMNLLEWLSDKYST